VLSIVVALAPSALFAMVALVPMGACSMAFIATANSTLQLNARDDMRGRVMAVYALVFLGSTPIGGPLIGWISQAWGARAGLLVGGGLSLAASVAAAVGLLRRRHQAAGEPPSHEVIVLPSDDVELEEAAV
jgi:MFS family permease